MIPETDCKDRVLYWTPNAETETETDRENGRLMDIPQHHNGVAHEIGRKQWMICREWRWECSSFGEIRESSMATNYFGFRRSRIS